MIPNSSLSLEISIIFLFGLSNWLGQGLVNPFFEFRPSGQPPLELI